MCLHTLSDVATVQFALRLVRAVAGLLDLDQRLAVRLREHPVHIGSQSTQPPPQAPECGPARSSGSTSSTLLFSRKVLVSAVMVSGLVLTVLAQLAVE
jgi:hypothetical protein